VSGICCNTGCNSTSCDSCSTGTCQAFVDPWETGSSCDAAKSLGSGTFVVTISSTLQSSTDSEDWFSFSPNDVSNACGGFINVNLIPPVGSDYDVELYRWEGSCSSLTFISGSYLAGSQADMIHWPERCSISDAGLYLVRVILYAAPSCTAPYSLKVNAAL